VSSGYLATGAEPKRYGNAHPTIVPYQLFDTADGVLALAVGNDAQFKTMCEQVLQRPDLAADARFKLNRDRVLNRETLVPLLAAIFRTRPTAAWASALRRVGVPVGEVRSVSQVFSAPEIVERGVVADVPHPRHGTMRLARSPLRLSDTPLREPTAPPALGEHTALVLQRELGMAAGEIEALQRKGVVR
jgi:crotonobetainyl-CoA:carnitine CoA-transferase CaiB-like acyl-CoA transferase